MDIKTLGIDPEIGGASVLYSGRVKSSEINTDKNTGEVSQMVQIAWFGGNQYFFVEPSSNLAQVGVGGVVLLSQAQNKGKNGLYADRSQSLTLVSVGGKSVTEQKGAA